MKKHQLLTESLKRFPNGTQLKHEVSGKFKSLLPYWIDGTGSVADKNGKCLFEKDRGLWAEVVEKKEPLLVSEDGKGLNIGDYFWSVSDEKWDEENYIDKGWQIKNVGEKMHQLSSRSAVLTQPKHNKAFSTKETAEEWILEANKPKEMRIELGGCFAVVLSDGNARLDYIGSHGIKISYSDWNKVNESIKQLSC